MDIAILSERFDNEVRRLHEAINSHTKDDDNMRGSLLAIDTRLRAVERLAWIAVGGTTVIGALVYIVGERLIHLLGK